VKPLPPGSTYEAALSDAYEQAMLDLVLYGECGVEIRGEGDEILIRKVPVMELRDAKKANPAGVVWYRLGYGNVPWEGDVDSYLRPE
jgi:hypothetical protein